MRIRKRAQVSSLAAFSSLSDPLDLHPVQLHPPPTTSHGGDPPNLYHFHTNIIGNLEEEFKGSVQHPHDYSRERSVVCDAETSNGVVSQSTSSPQVVGRWCEREKTFPLKKRRGSFESPNDEEQEQTTATTTVNSSDDQKKTVIMKTKMNKKSCTLPQKQQQQQEHQSNLLAAGKKKSRGGALMEGSRCSRVNGRGWRCCQQTLVGYSLCEHHLGKGRLRSINSVRSRSLAAAPKTVIVVNEEDEKKPSPPSLTLASKKRMKLGVVKARSISSLLGQTDGMMLPHAVAQPPPPPPQLDDNIHN